jgi:hypothetical protein
MRPTDEPMRLSFAALLGWVLPAGLLVGGAGAWPTWHLAGLDGLLAELWAAAIVLMAIMASAAVVIGFAAGGPRRATFAFLAAGMLRLVFSAAAGVAVATAAGVSARALFAWLGAFYVAMFAGEAAWMSRALQADARRLSLGEIRRRPTDAWQRYRIR